MIAARLGVNVDHVATVRQARGGIEPDPVTAAAIAELAGAEGITIHLREDRRHIQDRDLTLMRQTVKTMLNLEMAATEEMIGIACDVLPEVVSLVPEKRKELTTEGGLDVVGNADGLKKAIERLKAAGIRVSLFIDADPDQINKSAEIGADAIEIHTGIYCDAEGCDRQAELEKIVYGAKLADSLGLTVHAGHGLNYTNIKPVAAIPEIVEFNIGHSIISRSIFTGLDVAVREMVALINGARRG